MQTLFFCKLKMIDYINLNRVNRNSSFNAEFISSEEPENMTSYYLVST